MTFPRFARSIEEVIPLIQHCEERAALGEEWVLAVSFEAAPAFDPAFVVRSSGRGWLAAAMPLPPVQPKPALVRTLPDWWASIVETTYAAKFARIREHIAAGATYQVNFTYPMAGLGNGGVGLGSLVAMYSVIAMAARPAYGRFADFGESTVLSFSPELFFRKEGRTITSRPMKGTRGRGGTPLEDERLRAELASSEKDRAENLMIVDMVRNDLGRIAEAGSVRVEDLFKVTAHSTVWQMTSTVQAESDASLAEVFGALFPCASVVGAPKIETLKIIRELEDEGRGMYCGAIGVVGREFAEFNVAIRTIEAWPDGRMVYGVGSGIVWDSELAAEWDECGVKAAILNPFGEGLRLVETMLWDGQFWLLDRHVARMCGSATAFGVSLSEERVREYLAAESVGWGSERRRCRLTFDLETGALAMEVGPVSDSGPVRVRLAPGAVRSDNPWLRHKTSLRQIYDVGWSSRETPGEDDPTTPADDFLMGNERGEITEFTIGNVVVDFGGRLVTPPVECGLLPGVFRAELVDSGEVVEEVVRFGDLAMADGVSRVNSVRGWERVDILRCPDR